MAQASKLTINPPPPVTPKQINSEADKPVSKRARDSAINDLAAIDAGETNSPKRLKGQDVLFRIVVPSKQVGKVIGRVGSRIQKIREDTRATIKIADAIAVSDRCKRHEERVIIINCKDNNDIITDAEIALHQIVCLILKEDDGNVEVVRVGTGHVAANSIRLLIAGSQADCLIGSCGQNFEKMRISSGASIIILDHNQLPLCASAYESDRVIQISGEVSAILKAVVDIGSQLRGSPVREIISITPTYNRSITRTALPYVDPASADYVTFEMLISEAMVGGLIGKSGANISRIRTESGATIKVHGGKGEQKLRQIHFGGSSQQVGLAKQRVDEYIYSQLIHQADPQQVVDYNASMFPSAAVHPIHVQPPQMNFYWRYS